MCQPRYSLTLVIIQNIKFIVRTVQLAWAVGYLDCGLDSKLWRRQSDICGVESWCYLSLFLVSWIYFHQDSISFMEF